MKKLTPDDPEGRSPDIAAENLAKLKALFPEIVTEGPKGASVNVDVLKALVGDGTVTDAEEKYGLNWHGKRRARQLALTPSTGTLRPCPEESVDWDTTQNLMIEGDNLEVLKLLQKSYAGKVKLIYIDPPYNTGKDFVYPDNFEDSIRNYLELTGQVAGGRRITSNTESSGRFHTQWLNMIYPRLKLAHALLRPDGVLLVSLDATEVGQMRALCDEVFGEECFIMDLIWRRRDGAPNDRTIGSVHDYILAYARGSDGESARSAGESALNLMPRTEKADAEYQAFPEPGGPDPRGPFRKIDTTANAKGGRDVASLHFGVKNPHTGEVVYPRAGTCWRHSAAEMTRLQEDKRLYWGVEGTARTPMRKLFRSEAKPGMTIPSILPTTALNQHAAAELEELFGVKGIFDTPKPVQLLKFLVGIGSSGADVVLDFYAGSATTGHAVMALNAEGGGSRRYILVQLPEPMDAEGRDALSAVEFCDRIGKPRNIAELAKERLRRAAKKIKDENPMFAGDLGFRVFKLDSTNLQEWKPDPDDLDGTLLRAVDHVKADRTEADLLYEVLLKLGLDLCVPIEARTIAGKAVQSVGGGVLMACLPDKITREDVEALGQGIVEWRKALAPAGDTTCIFRDAAFADDVAKTNLASILEQNGIKKVRSL